MSRSRSRRTSALAILLIAAFALPLLSGCAAKTEDDSTIPWSRPASWEGGLPGMGGGGMGGGY